MNLQVVAKAINSKIKMDAIILAGGETPEKLKVALGVSAPTERALLAINGRTTIDYILESLQSVSSIGNTVVVAGPSTLEAVKDLSPGVIGVAAQRTLVENVMAGAGASSSSQLLICTCDIPLVTPETWREFLEAVASRNLEAAYCIASRQSVEETFPEGKRTYATLTDGTFTGGNAFVLPRANMEQLKGLIDAGYRARKNPLGLARLLGPGFVFKAVTKKLSIADLERKASQILKCRAGAVAMKDAGLAFDVDKMEDYQVAQAVLARSTPRIH